MSRYNNYSSAGGHKYDPTSFREHADRSDRRYDEFYGNHNSRSAPIGRKDGWDHNGRYSRSKESSNSYPGDKRRTRRSSANSDRLSPQSKRRLKSSSRESPRKEHKSKGNEKDPAIEEEIPEEEVVVPDTLMDSVEELRMRKEVKRNAVDEDVDKLIVFCFTGKNYSCKTCSLLMTKKAAFTAHLSSKSHIMNVIEARTSNTYQEVRDILEMDLAPDDWFEKNHIARSIIMKQSRAHMRIEREIKRKEEANFNRTPSNFYAFKMESQKSIATKEEKVIITSIVESSVEMNEFGGNKFFGCEFVRAVTGFHCRLCSVNIREAEGVMPHIDSSQHRSNYATYIKKNPDYEEKQTTQNKELCDIMAENTDKDIALSESEKARESRFLAQMSTSLVRIPTILDPELKKETEKKMDKKDSGKEKNGTESERNEDGKCKSEKKREKDPEKKKTKEETKKTEKKGKKRPGETKEVKKNSAKVVKEGDGHGQRTSSTGNSQNDGETSLEDVGKDSVEKIEGDCKEDKVDNEDEGKDESSSEGAVETAQDKEETTIEKTSATSENELVKDATPEIIENDENSNLDSAKTSLTHETDAESNTVNNGNLTEGFEVVDEVKDDSTTQGV